MDKTDEKREVDHLVYEGYRVPNFIRLAWTLLIVFIFVYLLIHMWPDLKLWLGYVEDARH